LTYDGDWSLLIVDEGYMRLLGTDSNKGTSIERGFVNLTWQSLSCQSLEKNHWWNCPLEKRQLECCIFFEKRGERKRKNGFWDISNVALCFRVCFFWSSKRTFLCIFNEGETQVTRGSIYSKTRRWFTWWDGEKPSLSTTWRFRWCSFDMSKLPMQ
jgi:hypothetical protein